MKLKKALLLFATALLLCLTSVFLLINAGAEGTDTDTDTEIIFAEDFYAEYVFKNDGYTVDSGELIPHTGRYLLHGEPYGNRFHFRSNGGERVTYDVILHNFEAESDYYGVFLLDDGVTLNLTVYGTNELLSESLPVFSRGEQYEGKDAPAVHVTVQDGSSLALVMAYTESGVVSEDVAFTVSEHTVTSLDLSTDTWKASSELTLTRGEHTAHVMTYVYVDEVHCRYSCPDCTLLPSVLLEHEYYAYEHEATHEHYDDEHAVMCYYCGDVQSTEPHTVEYEMDEDTHLARCYDCGYVSEPEAHTGGEHGCTVCGGFAVLHTVGESSKGYFLLENALSAISESGGTLVLLKDVISLFGTDIEVRDADLAVDLAGHTLENFSFTVGEGRALTVTDSAEEKGKWVQELYDHTSVYGNAVLSGIAVESGTFTVHEGGHVTMQHTHSESECRISLYGGTVSLTGITFEDTLRIYADGLYVDGSAIIHSGTFAHIESASSFDEVISVNRFLPSGYAYAGEGGILNGEHTEIVGVTEIVVHDQHTQNVCHHDASTHWIGCECGYSEATAERSVHTPSDGDHLCEQCNAELHTAVTYGDQTRYFSNVEAAVELANTYLAAQITLLRDTDCKDVHIRTDVTLDLGGFTLDMSGGRFYIHDKLTVTDTSEAQTGALKVSSNLGYVVQMMGGTSLTVLGGEIFGRIYTSLSNGETAQITVQGGRFTGSTPFFLASGTSVAVNGGIFENAELLFGDCLYYDVTVKISGGVFKNCTLFPTHLGEEPFAIENVLGESTCGELIFANEQGSELTEEALTSHYEGAMLVVHRGATLHSLESGHYLACDGCDTDYALLPHTDGDFDHACDYCGEEHIGTHADSDSDNDHVCDYGCGETLESCSHTVWDHDIEKHFHVCDVCGVAYDHGAHKDNSGEGLCDVCDYAMEEGAPHIRTGWDYDETYHWFACSCGERHYEYEPHTDRDENGICDACDYEMSAEQESHSEQQSAEEESDSEQQSTEQESHSEQGSESHSELKTEQDSTGAGAPPTPPADMGGNGDGDGGIGTGAVIAIAAGATAASAIGIFSLFWFVFKRKTLSELLGIFKK